MDSRARFHNNGNQIQRIQKVSSFKISLTPKLLLSNVLHSRFIFKGRGEEEVGLRPDLTRCRPTHIQVGKLGEEGKKGGTKPKEQVVGSKKRRHGTGENSRRPC